MQTLEIKHLAAYLPYGLKLIFEGKGGCVIILTGITDQGKYGVIIACSEGSMWFNGSGFKPILRPMSDLTKEIEHNGGCFIPIIALAKEFHKPSKYAVTHYDGIFDYGVTGIGCKCFVEHSNSRYSEFSIYGEELITHNDFRIVNKLFEWHFDVFNLIPQNLAIDINTLKPGH